MKSTRQRTSKQFASVSKTLGGQPVRLNKFLADAGIDSRRKVEELILAGAVKVNGVVCTELATKVSKTDNVTVNNNPIKEKINQYYILLNKPKDFITTTKDEKDRKTIMKLLPDFGRLYPVGRLDRNTTGVILITNDGDLAYRLTHPSYRIERVYRVLLDKSLKASDAEAIARGVDLDGELSAPCEVLIDPKDHTLVLITLFEGKNHEVKRLFEKFGYTVKQLERKSFAGLEVMKLKRGEWRHLNRQEMLKLRKLVNLA